MKIQSLLTISLTALLFLYGCSAEVSKSDDQSHQEADKAHVEHKENGDIQEETESAAILPKFLEGRPEHMRNVYKAAATNGKVLSAIPCYCGCGESAGHKNSLNCFVAEIKDDGTVVWDDHGTRCNVCIEIAAESIIQFNDGKSLTEIRTFIDNKYKEGYAKPTPTPMPKA